MGLFDVLSGVTGRGEGAGSPPDAPTGDEGEGKQAVDHGPANLSPADFRERAEALAGRSDVPELDFTEQALPDLDSMATGTHPVDDEITYGSYLGETLVREYDGEWVREDGWRVAVALGDDETTVAVFDAARMGLERGPVFAQVAERLHAQGDPYAEGTGEESVGDVTSSDADPDEDAPETTDDAGAPETADEGVLETDDDGTTGDEATGEEVTDDEAKDEFSPPPTSTASTADAPATAASSDEPIDDGEGGVETAVDVDSGEGSSDGGASADVTDPTAAVEDDAEPDLAEEGTAAAGEPAPDAADPDDVDVGATATDLDGPSDGELDAPERDPVTDEEGDETDDATLSRTDGEDAPDESREETVVDHAAVELDEDEGAADGDFDVASEPRARNEDADDSSIIDARSSELGVGPDGPTEADFAREPFDRPSSMAAAADAESVDDGTVDDPVETEPNDDGAGGYSPGPEPVDASAIRESAIEAEADAANESSEQKPDEATSVDEVNEEGRADDSMADRTVANGTGVGGTIADEPVAATDDPASAAPVSDDAEDQSVTGDADGQDGSGDDASGDEANEEEMEGEAGSETVPAAEERTSAGSPTDAPMVDHSPTDETPTGGVDVDEAAANPPADADEAAAETAPDARTADGATSDDESEAPSTEESDVGSVAPPTDADAPSRSEYEPAAISLKNDWADYDFDFTPGSLARLDTFLDDQWAGRFRPGSLDDSDVGPDAGGPLVEVGAYVGEVLIQHYDARWVVGDDGEPALAIPGRHGRTETFPVFDVARTSLTENARVAYAVDALANRLDLATRASGAEETAFALGDDGPGTATSSADVITTILDRAEVFVASWPGYDLNYRPASLVRLDNLAKDELDREAFRATTLGDRTDPDALRLADRATGASAYFAAVLVRHLDAQWEIDDEVALAVEGPAGETRVVPFEGSVDCLRGEASFMRRYDRVHDAVIDESRSTG